VLREGGGIKPREFRKFKNELLVPAIAEINEVTEISVELIEHREQSTLREVQFRVARRAREKPKIPDAADVTLVMRAAKLGIREVDLDGLTAKYGIAKVMEGMDAMEAYMSERNAPKIMNRAGYLKAVLANRFPEGSVLEPAGEEKLRPPKIDAQREREEMVDAWKASRLKQIRADFLALSEPERVAWIDQAAPVILQSAVATPAVRKRLADRDWESPLISRVVLDVFASAKFGPAWKSPSEMDLVMFSVASERAD
jgi:hypothetical protein